MAKSGKKKGKKKGSSLKLDFEGVESGSRAVADGTYAATIESAEEDESSEGNPMLKATYKLKNGAKLFDNVSLLPQALWRLKTLLECIGEEVPDGEYELDLADLVGKELMIEVTNEKWQGKDRPKVTGYGPLDEDADDSDDEEESDDDEDEDEDEDEKPSKKKSKSKGKSKKDEDDEDEEDEEDEEEEEEDEDEDEDEEDEPKKKKKGKKDEKKSKSKFKTGQSVTFKDDKGKKVKGVITEIDGDSIKVEDKSGDEWEVEEGDLTAA